MGRENALAGASFYKHQANLNSVSLPLTCGSGHWVHFASGRGFEEVVGTFLDLRVNPQPSTLRPKPQALNPKVGEVRTTNAAHVPLIGIVPLSVLKGADAFKPSAEQIHKISRTVCFTQRFPCVKQLAWS